MWPLRDDGNGGIINMESFLEFHANPEAACNTVHWLSSTTIVVGSAKNSIVSLWRVSDTAECLQTVKIISKQESGSTENYLHMAVQPEAGIIVLASAKSPAVYALHINNTADTVTLDYLAEFAVGMPILSLAADYMPSHDSDAVQLYCVQEKGIQMYTLNLAQCQPTPLFKAPSSALSEAASALPVLGSQNQPSESQLAEPQHSESQLSTPADPQKASSQHGASAQADQQQQSLQEAAGSLPGLPMRISTRPAVSLPDQPKLLTPKHLMQHAKRSASQQSISSLTGQQTPKSERASSSQAWDSLSNMGGEVPRSAGTAPGSTRSQVDNTDAVSTTSTQGSLLTPGDLSRPASAMSNSAGLPSAAALDAILKQKSPAASPAGSRSSTPPPSTPALPSAAYLTPEQYSGGPAAPPASDDAAPATPASPTAAAANDSSRNLFAEHLPNQAASPVQDSSSVKLLQRQVAAEADSDPMPSASRETSSAFEQPLDLLPVSNAATLSPPSAVQQLDPASAEGSTSQAQQQQRGQSQQAQQQQLSAPSLQSPAEPSQQAELSEGSVRRVVDAVAERTLAQQKRMLGYLHDGHREMLRIIKADIAKEGKRLQAAIEAQVADPLKLIAL